ncbi:MAG: hypothetical protein QXT26_08195 [Thermoproteota archaeon]
MKLNGRLKVPRFVASKIYNIIKNFAFISPLVFTTLFIFVVILVATWFLPYSFDVDSKYYKDIAEGRIYNVVKPFSNRILHPIIVGMMRKFFGINTDLSFFVVGVLSLIVLVLGVSLIAKSIIPYPAVIAFLLSPFLLQLFRDYYLPDIFHAAILALFFVCLLHSKTRMALLCLFLLHLTRESTLLLTLIILILGLHRRLWEITVGAILVAVVGIIITSYVANLGQPNIHDLNDVVYMLFKVPYNFLRNVFGLILWTNTLASNNPEAFPQEPLLKISVPSYLPLGAIHSLGIYGFNASYPLSTITHLLSTFGVLPSFVVFNLNKLKRQLMKGEVHMVFSLALLYGLLSFVIGTSVGASVSRLIGYGWPCFWIACPYIIRLYYHSNRKFLARLLLYHILACYFPFLLTIIPVKTTFLKIIVLCFLLIVHGKTLHEAARSGNYNYISLTEEDYQVCRANKP